MAKSQEELLREELESLTPEELEEYEQALLGKQKYAPSVSEMEAAKSSTEPTFVEGVAAGIMNTVPGMKQATEAYDAMAIEMQNEGASFDSVYERYKEQIDETDKDIAAAKNQAPGAAMVGELVGTAGSLTVGGIGLKAAGAGATLTDRGMRFATASGVGGAQKLSQEDTLDSREFVKGATIGAASEYLGEKVMKGGKYVFDQTGIADKVSKLSIKRLLGVWKGTSKESMEKTLARTGQTEDEFLSSIVTRVKKDGTPVINFQSKPSENVKSVGEYLDDVGNKLDDVYSSMDDKVEIKLSHLKEILKQEHASMSGTEDAIKLADDMARTIDNLGVSKQNFKVEIKDGVETTSYDLIAPEKISVKELHEIQKNITKYIERSYDSNMITPLVKQKQKLAASIREANLFNIKNKDENAYYALKELNKEYTNMSTVKDSLRNLAKNENSNNRLATMTDLIAVGIGSTAGPVGAIAAPLIKRYAADPRTHLRLSEGYLKIANIIQASPQGEFASRIATASMMNSESLEKELNSIVGEVALRQNPIKRSSNDALEKQYYLRDIIKRFKPEALTQFDKIINSGNPQLIGSFMDGISKMEEAQDLFENGVGFDGFVYTDEDKAQLELQLRQTDMPGAQRMELLRNLRLTGQIPDLESIVVPEPKSHIPRTKKIQDY